MAHMSIVFFFLQVTYTNLQLVEGAGVGWLDCLILSNIYTLF